MLKIVSISVISYPLAIIYDLKTLYKEVLYGKGTSGVSQQLNDAYLLRYRYARSSDDAADVLQKER